MKLHTFLNLKKQQKQMEEQQTDKPETVSENDDQPDRAEKAYESLSEAEFQLQMSELNDPMSLTVEVVYATNEKQVIKEVQLPRNATIEDGIVLSGILDSCGDIALDNNKVGIFGIVKPLTQKLLDGDRIEIYRPVNTKV